MKNKWFAEFLWWFITIIIVVLIVLPIYQAEIPFPFYDFNILFIFLGVSLARTILFFQTHPLNSSRLFKTALIFTVPFVFFPLIEGLHSFIEFNDREGIQSLLAHLPYEKQKLYTTYIRWEYLFFGILCFTGVFILIVKMIRSLWRQYKYEMAQ